ncbi:MAG: DedA family protein [Desulfobacteraceae bacterium]|nr:MAG: DedA family protein [Desulfobacteraceae bacterium]
MNEGIFAIISKPLRALKEWVEGLASKPSAGWALFLIAFAESSFFPIPPDVLLIALAVMLPRRSFRYALICSIGSVLGGMLGYVLGMEFYELIGRPIIHFYGVEHQYHEVQGLYEKNAFLSIAIAGFTPIPYKVFTIAAGAFHIPFLTLVTASILSRSLRFFLVAALFYWFGPPIKALIDKYFEWLTLAFIVLLVLGFVVIRKFM